MRGVLGVLRLGMAGVAQDRRSLVSITLPPSSWMTCVMPTAMSCSRQGLRCRSKRLRMCGCDSDCDASSSHARPFLCGG
jgi:hypothetical protein